MLTHAGKLRLGVVGAVIGGPPVAMLFISTTQPHFVRRLPVKGSLLVRFTSLYDGPALKGEVGFAKQKPEGLKKERSFACYRQPLRRLISTLYLCTDGWAYFSSYFLAYSAKSAL